MPSVPTHTHVFLVGGNIWKKKKENANESEVYVLEKLVIKTTTDSIKFVQV